VAKNVVCSSDALSELLISVDLDIYINDITSRFPAKDQGDIEKTCYAFASATVLHLAMHRIHGRNGGHREFDELKNEMIDRYGTNRADTETVLKQMCKKYRFCCQKVSVEGAKKAIVEKRLVVTRFRLTDNQWDAFEDFYKKKAAGILTKNDLCPSGASDETHGHAVVLVSYNSKCLIFMNSWGGDWPAEGMNGLFKVQNSQVLPELEFFDVYRNLDKLTEEEKKEHRMYGFEVAGRLINSLKGLQKAEYTCPECEQTSLVTEFNGTLSKVQCPKCLRKFSTNDKTGNILALNMYLTSLSR
jgi:ribosomal protein L37AE/L43A